MTTHYQVHPDGARTLAEPCPELEPIVFGEAFNPEPEVQEARSAPVSATTGPDGLLELLATYGGKTSLCSWLRDRAMEFAQQWQAERDGGLAAGLEGSYAVSLTWERYCSLTDCETRVEEHEAECVEYEEIYRVMDRAHDKACCERDAALARVAELEAEQASGYRSGLNGAPGRLEQRWAEMHPESAAEHGRRRELTPDEEHGQAVGRG